MAVPTIAEADADADADADAGADDPVTEAADNRLDELDVGEGAEPVDDGDDVDAPNVAEVELTEDDVGNGSNGLFSGDETRSSTSNSGDDSQDSGEDDEETSDPLGLNDDSGSPSLDSLATAINEGAARLAVTGLDDDDEKESLEAEFCETFETFQLGHFASQAADEYVIGDPDEEINPLWGLLGTSMLCAAFALWTRPDSETQLDRLREAVDGITAAEGGDSDGGHL